MRFRKAIPCLLAVLLAACPLLAQHTIHVPADQPTIQAAIDASSNGDTVLVAPGTYYENLLVQSKSINLKSEQGSTRTILDGGKKGIVLILAETPSLDMTVDGFTIQNGYTPGYTPPDGGIQIDSGFATIKNNLIAGNWGNAIHGQSATLNILNNHIVTTAPNAGQLYCYVYTSEGINITSNTVTYGGPIYQTRIAGNLIEGDGTTCSASAMGITATDPVLIENNIVHDNLVGIGVSDLIRRDDNVHVIVRQNLIYHNRSVGLYFDYFPFYPYIMNGVEPITMVANNNTIYSNLTSGPNYTAGGANLDGEVKLSDFFARMALFNNIIVGNSAVMPTVTCDIPDNGNPIFNSNVAPPVFDHNDIFSLKQPSSSAILFNCGYTTAPLIGLDGNISADPLFLAPATADFHVQNASPTIDAGNNSAAGLATADFEGTPRPQDYRGNGYPVVDMGAYELTGAQNMPISKLVLTSSSYYQYTPAPITLTAPLTSPTGPVAGPITFYQDDVAIGTVLADASGTATFPLNLPVYGLYRFTATYPGSAGLAPSISTVIFIRGLTGPPPATATNTTLTCTPNPAYLDQRVTIAVVVTPVLAGNTVPTGSVTLTDANGTLANLALLNGSQSYGFSLPIGSYVVNASYTSTNGYATSTASCSFKVIGRPSTTTLVTSLTPAPYARAVTLTAGVSGQVYSPTGTVVIQDAGVPISPSLPLDASDHASFTTSTLTPGTHTLTAVYSGDGGLAPSTSSPLAQVVLSIPTATTLTMTPSPAAAFQFFTVTAQVSSLTSIPLSAHPCFPTCTVTFTIAGLPANSPNTASAIVSTSGIATARYAFDAGSYTFSATFDGSPFFASSSATPLVQQVIPAATTLTLTAPVTSVYQPSPINLSSTLTAPLSTEIPSGTLTLYDGTTAIASLPFTSSIFSNTTSASLALANLSVGDHILTAFYPGSTNFLPVTSPPLTVTIKPNDFAIIAPQPNLTLKTEHNGPATITLSSIGIFTDSLDLSCDNLPEAASCTFAHPTIQISAGQTISIPVQIDTDVVRGYARQHPPNSPRRSPLYPVALAGLLPLALFLGRRRRSRIALLGIVLATVFAVSSIGCSGKYPDHTPPGVYTIHVTATAHSANRTHSTPIILTVTP